MRLLRQETVRPRVLVPLEDLEPPMRDVGHGEDQWLGRPYYLRLIGDVSKSRQCVKIEGTRSARAVLQDLPGKLVLQGFFGKLRGFDPFGQFDGGLLESRLVCTGIAQHGRRMR